MDKHCIKTFQELSNMQSKIASLFEDLLIERYHYKLSSDKLKKNLEEVSIEVKNLKKENEKLQQGNQELKSVICECIKIFNHLDFSEANLVKDRKIVIDTVKKMLSQCNHLTPELLDTCVTVKKSLCLNENESSSVRCNTNQDVIKNEIDAIKDLQFTTQFFENAESNKEKELLNKRQSDLVLENLFDRKSNQDIENFEEPLLVKETEPFDEKNDFFGSGVQETVDPLSEVTTSKKKPLLNSPVFKDSSSGNQENLSTKENLIDDSKNTITNVKLFTKCTDLIISPLKKTDMHNSVSPKRDFSPVKRTRKKLKMSSPIKSPVNQLKKSYSREAEISISGVRKFTQTLLNIECFKKKSPEKRKNAENDEKKGKLKSIQTKEMKALPEFDEDDVIMDSPKKFEQILEDININKKTEFGSNQICLTTTPTTSVADLDETFVSASIIKKCQGVGKHILEEIEEDETPVKRPNRKRSPDKDSVPFVYKGEVVRSKAERMKLPGHACLECNKYYKNVLGEDLKPEQLKEILNKCSRHRDKNSPSRDDTPFGYWKPYLTASVNATLKDDTLAVRNSRINHNDQ